ncbi:PHP domain-containing protein [Teredinibacter turnerae]|uniref:PHP domain-containing protein n=1 Tax=Teredinibacter turnerae TaxID=2426 RepID=UPI0003735C26|nr:PHP domain-containing protein [Teredinibacter turnerae]
MQVYDLHSHSSHSDGVLSPVDLVMRAKSKQVDVLALTDHDTVSGLEAAAKQATIEGIDLIPGIELSSQWNGCGVHIVGLALDLGLPDIHAAVADVQRRRQQRAETIAEKLAKAGIPGALAGASAIAGGETLGRPHFARHLVREGHVSNVNQAFKRYLGAGKPCDVKNVWPSVEEVVHWVLSAGGTPVLAHPAKYKMTRTKLCRLVDCFTASGGLALEVVNGRQAVGMADNLARIATQYGLAASIGSDFHLPDQPWQELGCSGSLPAQVRPVWELW